LRWRLAIQSEEPMNCIRSAVALLLVIAKNDLPVTSSQNQSGAQTCRTAPDYQHIYVHDAL
jgi:hypothetical protein